MSNKTISVCLVDDQTLVRQGIRSLLDLSDDIRVTAEAGDGTHAVEVIPRVKPDVVLLDMRMPGMSGRGTYRKSCSSTSSSSSSTPSAGAGAPASRRSER